MRIQKRCSCSIGGADLIYGLGPQKDCLESITINYDLRVEYFWHWFGETGSFTRFGALKVFKIAAQFLLATVYGEEHRRLPNVFRPSLEILHVLCLEPRYKDLLEALAFAGMQVSTTDSFPKNPYPGGDRIRWHQADGCLMREHARESR